MIYKKVCMLGTLSVGKTSLVSRYVSRQFSESYQTTIGVKVDRKQLNMDGQDVVLMLWDLEGVDKFHDLRASHLRGASGFILVVDTTRAASLQYALDICRRVEEIMPKVPLQAVLNKSDLSEEWSLDPHIVARLDREKFPPIRASAKTGENVETIFLSLARRMILPTAMEKQA